MYVHINQRILETRPVLGLLLGAVTMVLTLVIYGALYGEYKAFGKVPEEVDLKTVVPPRQDHGRWVRITQPMALRCDHGIQELRDWEEQWLFGKVSDTYYLSQVSGSDRSVLLDYEGNTTCEGMSHMEMTGVLEELTARRREVMAGEGFLFPSSGVVMQPVFELQSPSTQESASVEFAYSYREPLPYNSLWQEVSAADRSAEMGVRSEKWVERFSGVLVRRFSARSSGRRDRRGSIR